VAFVEQKSQFATLAAANPTTLSYNASAVKKLLPNE
jgi:hypothetical protein